jgi:hypothetical protein
MRPTNYIQWNIGSQISFIPGGRSSPEMFVNRNYFCPIVSYLIIYKKPQNTMKFKRRHGEFEQGCVLSESYTVTDALPLIPSACRQPLLLACVFITRDTVRHLRLFFGKFVRDERRS